MDTTMTQHTPGPWFVDGLIVTARKKGSVGFAYGPSMPENSAVGRESLANAKLIAAAPDMANALRSLLRHTERMQEVMDKECGIRFRDDGPIGMARDALRLAVGAA